MQRWSILEKEVKNERKRTYDRGLGVESIQHTDKDRPI